MTAPECIVTERLILRRDWREADRVSLHRLCSDPHAMRFMVHLWTREDTDAAAARWHAHFASHGYSIWAVEERASGRFAGMVGAIETRPGDPFPQAETELAWRLDTPFWGKGYAGEAAIAAGNDALGRAPITGFLAYCTAINAPSRRVMEKLGLTHRPAEDFDHPTLPADDPKRRRVVYRIAAAQWRARHGGSAA